MRSDNEQFRALSASPVKELRRVVEVEFDPNNIITFTSHEDIYWQTGTVYRGYIAAVSSVSQKLDPKSAKSTIGRFNFDVIDFEGAVTLALRNQQLAGREIVDKKVRYYIGGESFPQSAFVLASTQIAQEATYEDGLYRFRCADIQHSQRKYIFNLADTTLTNSISAVETTIPANNTTGFEMLTHNAAWSDAPSQTVGYIKLGKEVIRYTGMTATSFTGCTRGALNTIATQHTVGNESEDRRPKIEEYVYLEYPSLKLLYAVLTGTVYGEALTLPTTWHLGIPAGFVRLSDFLDAGPDVWSPSDDGVGIPLRFEGLKRQDGKQFIEREVMRLLNSYSPIYADGTVGFRRRTNIGNDAGYVRVLDETNVIDAGDLSHDTALLSNSYTIDWNWNGERFTRSTRMYDAESINLYGVQSDSRLGFKGLHGARHTRALVLSLIDNMRDSFSDIPLRMTLTCLFSQNDLEVGDLVRVRLPSVRDYQGTASDIDRTFEIQQVTRDDEKGTVKLSLFGSSKKRSTLANEAVGVAPPMPDAWYSSEGTNLTTVPGLTFTGSNPTVITGSGTLTGGADANDPANIYYFTGGDLELANGATLNITQNVQIRVRGFLDIKGTINGRGNGLAGVAAGSGNLAGQPGYLGSTWGHDYLLIGGTFKEDTYVVLFSMGGFGTGGKYMTMPEPLGLLYDDTAGSILGIPPDLRGTSGGRGGGPNCGGGGNGGAGLVLVCRGMDFSNPVQGEIDLSGGNSTDGTTYVARIYDPTPGRYRDISAHGAAGAPGAPGGVLVLLDGGAAVIPSFANHLTADYGDAPEYGVGVKQIEESPWYPGNTDVENRTFGAFFRAHQNQQRWKENNRVVFIPTPAQAEVDATPNYPTLLYYIKPTNGTAIEGGLGTLTIEARQITTEGDSALNAGTVKMYLPNDTLAGDGFTATLDAAAIGGSIVITLKDGVSGTPLDTITLIDISGTVGTDATFGSVTASAGLAFTRAPNNGAWSPGNGPTDLLCTFYEGGASIATRTVRVSLNQTNGELTASDLGGTGAATSFALTGQTTTALTVTFTHIDTGVTVSESVVSVAGGLNGVGTDAVLYYIKSLNGNAIHNGSGTLNLEARRIEGTSDALLATGAVQLYDGTTPLGYTEAFNAASITGSVVVELKDGPAGNVYDSVTLVDVQDGGAGVMGWCTPSGSTAWLRDVDQLTWTPAATTLNLDFDFAQGGLSIGRVRWVITRDANGLLSGVQGTHPGGNLLTNLTVLEVNEGARSMTVKVTYDDGTLQSVVTQPVLCALSGEDGSAGLSIREITIYRRGAVAPGQPTGGSYDFQTGILTPPSTPAQWYEAPPAGTDPVYVSKGVAAVVGQVGVDSTITWSAPVLLVQNGSDGSAGAGYFNMQPSGAATMALTARTAKKTDNNGFWNGGFYTDESFTDGCYIQFRVKDTTENFMIGLDSGPATDGNYTGLDYVIYMRNDNTIYAYESNVSQGLLQTGYNAGDLIRVEYNGLEVRYMVNGTIIDRVIVGGNRTFFGVGAFYHALGGGPPAYDISFGPLTSVKINANLTPASDFAAVAADYMGGWNRDTGALANCSIVNNVTGPHGSTPRMVRIVGDGVSLNWYGRWRYAFPVEDSKPYITYIWIRKIADNSAICYLGYTTDITQIADIAGVPNSNIYFAPSIDTECATGQWYLGVGIIHPHDYTGGDTGIAGLYNPTTGARIIDGAEARHLPGATHQWPRFGFYNNVLAQPNTQGFDFLPAGTFLMDGSEPTKEQIMQIGAMSIAELSCFRRSASAPTAPTGGSYNFTTQTLTPPASPAQWYTIPPAGTDPVYISRAVASVVGQIGTDSGLTWSNPALLVQDGATGDDGSGVDIIFKRSAAQPATPSPSTTTPATWYSDVASVPVTTDAMWSSVGQRPDSISNYTWDTPVKIEGEQGDYVDIRFKRVNGQPAAPSGDEPVGWTNYVPDGTATLWTSQATKDYLGVLVGGWSTPRRITALTFRGAWLAGETYYQFDVVTYGGNSYVCITTSPSGITGAGTAPTGTAQANSYWDLLAGEGDAGAPGDPPSGYTLNYTLNGTTNPGGGPVNLRTIATAQGYSGTEDATINITVDQDVTGTAGSAGSGDSATGGSATVPAIRTGTWPSGTYTIDINITVAATRSVRGGGGAGGNGAGGSSLDGGAGGNGGDAFYCEEACDITNSGTIRGGGGGGGGGGRSIVSSAVSTGGGGGGGAPNGAGGAGGTNGTYFGATGATGTVSGGGTGGSDGYPVASFGNGGNGGGTTPSIGGNGEAGDTPAPGADRSGGTGGGVGYAVRKNGWTVNVTGGTVNGTVG